MEARKAAREAIRAACLSLAAAARLRGLVAAVVAEDEKRSCLIRWTASARGLYSPTLGARALPRVAERRSRCPAFIFMIADPPRGDRPLRGENEKRGGAGAATNSALLTQENSVDDENDRRLLLHLRRDGRTACLTDLATALARLILFFPLFLFVCFCLFACCVCLLAVFAACCRCSC